MGDSDRQRSHSTLILLLLPSCRCCCRLTIMSAHGENENGMSLAGLPGSCGLMRRFASRLTRTPPSHSLLKPHLLFLFVRLLSPLPHTRPSLSPGPEALQGKSSAAQRPKVSQKADQVDDGPPLWGVYQRAQGPAQLLPAGVKNFPPIPLRAYFFPNSLVCFFYFLF